MPIRVVLLDWGGVISPGGTPDELVTRMAQNLDKHPDKIRDTLREQTEPLKRGLVSVEQFWSTMERELGHEIPLLARDVWTAVDDLAPSEKMTAFVEKLKAQGYIVAILSNTFPNTAEDIRSQGWYGQYDPVILSSDIRMAKPDPEIYDYVLSIVGCALEEIVFVDDQQKCLTPAAAAGMKTILARDTDQVIRDISEILELT